jgi:hypothetical protein
MSVLFDILLTKQKTAPASFSLLALVLFFLPFGNLAIAQSPAEALSNPLVLQELNLAAAQLTGNLTGADHPDGPGKPLNPAKYGTPKEHKYWKAKNENGEITVDLDSVLMGSGATTIGGATIVLMGTLIHENPHGKAGVPGGSVFTDFDKDGADPPTDSQCEHAQAHLAAYEYYCANADGKKNPGTPDEESQLSEACAIVQSKLKDLKAMGTLLAHCVGRTEPSTSGSTVLPDVGNYQGDLEPCSPCNEPSGGDQ